MKKFLSILAILFTLLTMFSVVAFAESAEVASSSESNNFFDEAYSFLLENADKILSALAFTGSLILAFAYRKGMIPLLKGGLGKLCGEVSSLKEDTEKAEGAAREILSAATDMLTSAEMLISELSEKLSVIEEELAAAKEEEKRNADLKALINTQIDLLHDIFMSSSLPYYRKEEVGEKVAEMKKMIAVTEADTDE